MNTEDKKTVVVIGSSNTDMVIRVHHLPAPGETILGHDFMTNQGGKGANQAVAARRLDAEVTMIGCVGRDANGQSVLEHFKEEGIDKIGRAHV